MYFGIFLSRNIFPNRNTMRTKYTLSTSQKLSWLLISFLILAPSLVQAQSEPFQCDYSAYLFQYADVYAIDLASGRSYLVAESIVPGKINATAYNPKDGYIWGSTSEPGQSIVRIGKDFSTELYTFPELPSGNRYVGDINADGIYYMRAGSATYHAIDLNPESPNYLQYLGSSDLSKKINIHDWAFNAVDNKLYTVERKTNILYRISIATGNVEELGVVPILSGLEYTYGAVYFDGSGNFYVSANQTGSVYIINEVQHISNGEISSNIFAYGPASASNDGARCPTAPVPQEDCANGVDDDGDGLIDCQDPACSGIQACPVTYTATANGGGLESNDRLANLIANRNFQRAKNNYTFSTDAAARVKKSSAYKTKRTTAKGDIELSSLVPLGVIGEDEVVESSPADLLDLTNASAIYSVDYLQGQENIAAMMVIKTDERVYEHSKFICDRFLGAQLLSVSNIKLREHDFIKSIIRQPDGSTEFALTFSGRLNPDNQFIIESHWNIDAYRPDSAYYNFQIWSNTIDDLLYLAEEVLSLLEVNHTISSYIGSRPPEVFVKSAKYNNGMIDLQLVNNNNSEVLQIEGGLKRTETSEADTYSFDTPLNGYLDSVRITSGSLFDFGFRIRSEKGNTPDDLFVADAPWGLDQSAETSYVDLYEVNQNETSYSGDGYRVERNIRLQGRTSEYLGVYRALCPRFTPVDLSDYSNLIFEASGTGPMQVKLLKGNGMHYTALVTLETGNKTFALGAGDFDSNGTKNLDFSDLKVVSFELASDNGQEQRKELLLGNVEFTNQSPATHFVLDNTDKSLVMPNPVVESAMLYFYEENAGNATFNLFSMGGRNLSSHRQQMETRKGQNEIVIQRKALPPGIYPYKLESSSGGDWSGWIMVR